MYADDDNDVLKTHKKHCVLKLYPGKSYKAKDEMF